ncbi:MAG: hypothetical protein JTT11_05360 [Candidatus Brockarchaeota archaeon]|nr:hypothetical protein [Candidatus Brockarchaeota archaeon]
MDASSGLDFRIEMPNMRAPISFIVDDSAPCINPLYYYRAQVGPSTPEYYSETKGIPNDFLLEFVEVVAEYGVKGKFTVIPFPAGLGSVETWLQGYSVSEMREWLDIVRKNLLGNFDITPEMLTHTLALNLETNSTIPSAEQEDWHKKQNFDTLVPYISRALEILRDAGLSPNGVTSPGAFGYTIEGDYARAVLEAEKRVNGRKVAWYFLHTEEESKIVMPRLMYMDRWKGEAVVSMVSCNDDWIWETMTKEVRSKWSEELVSAYADKYVSSDGRSGRLVEVLDAGSYVAFHTHWNSMFSNGAKIGLRVMREVFGRIDSLLGSRVQWMKFSDVAMLTAASASLNVKAAEKGGGLVLELDTPFPCRNLTVSFRREEKVKEAFLSRSGKRSDEIPISEAGDGIGRLDSNTWTQRNGRVYVCVDLSKGNEVRFVTS